MNLQDLRDWLAALSTLVVGAVALWIAYHQLRIERYRLRHDLSQRRLEVFVAVRDLLKSEVVSGPSSDAALTQFDLATASAPFLFGPDVTAFLAEVRSRYVEILGITDEQKDGAFPDDATRSERLEQRRRHRQWMREQLVDTQRVFKKYLDLSQG